MRITAKMLRDKKACASQYALFVATFPRGCTISEKMVAKARAAGLDVLWATCLLTPEAWAQYEAACAPARAQYDAACDAAWAQYKAVCDPAFVAACAMMDEVKK